MYYIPLPWPHWNEWFLVCHFFWLQKEMMLVVFSSPIPQHTHSFALKAPLWKVKLFMFFESFRARESSSFWGRWRNLEKNSQIIPLELFIHTSRVRYLKLTTWQLCGNCRVFSSVRITAMEWERLLREQRPALITTREATSFLGWGWGHLAWGWGYPFAVWCLCVGPWPSQTNGRVLCS